MTICGLKGPELNRDTSKGSYAILSTAERYDNQGVLVEIRHHDRNLAAGALLSALATGVIESCSGFWWRPSHVNRSQGFRIHAFTASLSWAAQTFSLPPVFLWQGSPSVAPAATRQ